jgi:hypothetical protein
MTQVTPALDHPLRMHSELPRFNRTPHLTSSKAEFRAELESATQQFLAAGGSIEKLSGFPELIESNVVGHFISERAGG